MAKASTTGATRVPLSARQIELLDRPSIASQLPVVFVNGAHWYELVGRCRACDSKLPDDCMTGQIVWPIPTVAVVEAVGVCHACMVVTSYDYRLHDDMRISGLRDGTWRAWQAVRVSRSGWRKLVDLLLFRTAT